MPKRLRVTRNGTIEEWLVREGEAAYEKTGNPILHLPVFRVSSTSPSVFVANLSAGLQASRNGNPDVELAKEVGGLLVERNLEGLRAREKYGTYDLLMSSLPGGGHSNQLIGHATRFGNSVFVYLLSTAASANLFDADEPEDRGNAAVETVRLCVRVLTEMGGRCQSGFRLHTHYADHTRPARSRPQAAKLVATHKHHGALLVIRGQVWDPRRQTDEQIIDMLMNLAATDRDYRVAQLTKGKAALLAIHRLPEDIGPQVPFTHEPRVELRHSEDGATTLKVIDDHALQVMDGAADRLRGVVHAVTNELRNAEACGAKTVDWLRIAEEIGPIYGLQARSVEAAKSKRAGNDPVLLTDLSNPASALRRSLAPSYIEAWRTGRLPWKTTLPIEIDEGLMDEFDDIERSAKGVVIHAWVESPIPHAGWGISDEEWELLLRWVIPRSNRAGKPSTGYQRPFPGDRWEEPRTSRRGSAPSSKPLKASTSSSVVR